MKILSATLGLALASQMHVASAGEIDDAVRLVGSPSVNKPLSADNAVQIQASSTTSTASIKASSKRSETDGGFSTFSLIGQTPIGKGSTDNASLATLDGLANGTTLELKYSDVRLKGSLTPGAAVADDCEKKYKPLFVEAGKKADDFVCDTATIKSLVTDKTLLVEHKALKESDYEDFKKKFFDTNASVWSWGLSAKGGYQDFTFYDATTLAQNKQRHSLWSASIFGAYLPVWSASALTATLSIESSYKDAKSKSLCLQTPPTSGQFLTCANGPIGEPPHQTTEILNLEWRRQISDTVAFSLQASRDFKNKITTFQLPVYFIGGTKGGLTGGLTVGWTSEDHKGSLGVFVGQAFSLLD